MEKKECIKYLESKLKSHGAQIYSYGGVEFIAIQNPYSDNHIAITFSDEEFSMEFTYQTARFSYGSEEDAILHITKYLTEQLCAVEIFLNGKPLFGGSRNTEGCKFSTVNDFTLFYACGNEQIAENLIGFMKNGNVSVKIFSWAGKYDKSFEIIVDGENLSIKE
jgi:hypothetical protein